MREKPVAFAAVCGLILVLVGLASGNTTYGSGYIEAKTLLDGNAALPESYGLLKMTATLVSYLSGIPGGILAPTLSAGAEFGANIAHFSSLRYLRGRQSFSAWLPTLLASPKRRSPHLSSSWK
ncbi:MAG: chloride channel protein [Gallionella sp.]